MSVVIIPAYKPDERLVGIVDQLWTYGFRIVVVDDGSGEDYLDIFNRINDVCILLRHEENRGKGAAIKTALDYVNREIWGSTVIGVMDCDGQHLPEDLLKLFVHGENSERLMILGVRNVGKDMPLKSRLGNTITRKVFKLLSGVSISDTQTGMRVFTSDLVKKLLTVEGERYEYEMNVLLFLAKEGIDIDEVPINTIYQDRENSTSHFRAVWDSIRIYKDLLKFTLSSFSSFVLDYLLFAFFMFCLPHTAMFVLGANILARLVSAFYNYCMNCYFVFHKEKKIQTAMQYFELAAFILVMNNIILEALTQIIHMPVYPAKILTECTLFLISWLVQNFLIFARDPGNRLMSGGRSRTW